MEAQILGGTYDDVSAGWSIGERFSVNLFSILWSTSTSR